MKTKQRSKTKESPKWHILFAGIGALNLALPIYAVMRIKDFFKSKKSNIHTLSDIKLDKRDDNTPLTPYKEHTSPVDDREFISRIDEFICFQFKRFNGLSRRSYNYQLLASESPELKEYVLRFFEKQPIENLLYGDVNCNACDMDHWELRMIFEDQNLNRCIRGYGTTEVSAPFLCELVPYLIRMHK